VAWWTRKEGSRNQVGQKFKSEGQRETVKETIAKANREKRLMTHERIRLHKPLEIWESFDGRLRWEVYRKAGNEQSSDATWLCKVFSPFVPEGELGEVYVQELKQNGRRVEANG
jgi:hypothetical protein